MLNKNLVLLSIPAIFLVLAYMSNYSEQGGNDQNQARPNELSSEFGRPPSGSHMSGPIPEPKGTPSSDFGRPPGEGHSLRGGQPPRQARPLPKPGS